MRRVRYICEDCLDQDRPAVFRSRKDLQEGEHGLCCPNCGSYDLTVWSYEHDELDADRPAETERVEIPGLEVTSEALRSYKRMVKSLCGGKNNV